MKIQLINFEDGKTAYYTVRGEDPEIYEMRVTVAMIRDCNSSFESHRMIHANLSQVASTVFSYHRMKGKPAKPADMFRLAADKNYTALVHEVYKTRSAKPLSGNQVYSFL